MKKIVRMFLGATLFLLFIFGGAYAYFYIPIISKNKHLNTCKSQYHPWDEVKERESNLPSGQELKNVVVKFVEGSFVRVRGGKLVSLCGEDLSGFYGVLRKYNSPLFGKLAFVSRVFSRTEEEIDATTQKHPDNKDLNLFYRVRLGNNNSEEVAAQITSEINKLNIVETAYMEPLPSNAGL